MKSLRLLLLAPLLMAFQCEDDIDIQEDLLSDSGIYAGWELVNQSINGLSDMLPAPDMTLEFYPDTNRQDRQGQFNLEEQTESTQGIFILDLTLKTITFKREDKADIVYEYILNSEKDYLTFSFTESHAQFEQGWRKIY